MAGKGEGKVFVPDMTRVAGSSPGGKNFRWLVDSGQ